MKLSVCGVGMTETMVEALRIIRDHEIDSPRQFALFMWPDAAGWNRLGKCGQGTTRGGGMNLAGGAYLGKLKKRGLIYRYQERFYLTDEGKVVIE